MISRYDNLCLSVTTHYHQDCYLPMYRKVNFITIVGGGGGGWGFQHVSERDKQIPEKIVWIFGSKRSPRRGNVVCACVRPCVLLSVRDIIQKNIENEF